MNADVAASRDEMSGATCLHARSRIRIIRLVCCCDDGDKTGVNAVGELFAAEDDDDAANDGEDEEDAEFGAALGSVLVSTSPITLASSTATRSEYNLSTSRAFIAKVIDSHLRARVL